MGKDVIKKEERIRAFLEKIDKKEGGIEKFVVFLIRYKEGKRV